MGARTGRPERSPGPAGVRSAAKTLARTIIVRGGARHLVDAAAPILVFLTGYQMFGWGWPCCRRLPRPGDRGVALGAR
ncbi:hypothetical protein KO481_10520 [Nocardia sp. NEAU-G5]|uniref:Uncharacterized protein n=1 Tax=Nocardia albiluteola TaxID=2842303 RepID=A0ABS6AV94_9NOCA|nr:hypothetical protein [Nocardia albiluteola]MBU3061956.1 hypothetical protein [Nocardia albiluteola]